VPMGRAVDARTPPVPLRAGSNSPRIVRLVELTLWVEPQQGLTRIPRMIFSLPYIGRHIAAVGHDCRFAFSKEYERGVIVQTLGAVPVQRSRRAGSYLPLFSMRKVELAHHLAQLAEADVIFQGNVSVKVSAGVYFEYRSRKGHFWQVIVPVGSEPVSSPNDAAFGLRQHENGLDWLSATSSIPPFSKSRCEYGCLGM